ncbi:MAG: penicillin acylase family protein [Chloroflexi bacterium]|nr:penicillin acylase family protein [Chloroflexota bacterium]
MRKWLKNRNWYSRKWLKKWLKRVGTAVLALILIGAIIVTWLVRRAWPKLDGTLTVAGLEAPVDIVRDEWSVPHIYAENEHDLFFALGYTHAQDRLWQMEFNRRSVNGRLSEIVGTATSRIDYYYRNLRLYAMADDIWINLDAESQSVLQAYADGVNAYIETNDNKLPAEFVILGIKPEPWTPIDTLAWGNMMAQYLSSNSNMEFMRAQMVDEVGEEVMNALLPATDDDRYITVLPEVNAYAGFKNIDPTAMEGLSNVMGTTAEGVGSNGWVVSGDHTETGLPILENDIHIGLTLPSIWYAIGLHGGRFDTVGFGLAGVPGVISGHNQDIAWGMTNLGPDTQDYFLVKLNDPDTPTQYEFDGEWRDLEIIEESVIIRNNDPLDITLYMTHFGPVMAATVGKEDVEPMALRWTMYDGDNQLFPAILQLNTAQNWDQFQEALSSWHLPGQNFLYADMDGNIGLQVTGNIPIRAEGHSGNVPIPGWTSDYAWQGYIPFEELPSEYNPESGYIVNANSRSAAFDYPYRITDSYSPPYRAERIASLLEEKMPINMTDMHDVLMDTYSPTAALLLPYLLEVEAETPLQEQVLDLVSEWDMYSETDRVGASIYEAWHLHLLQNVVADDLGQDLSFQYISGQYLRHATQHVPFLVHVMAENDSRWLDDQTTEQEESRDDIVQRSFEDTLTWLTENYGDDPTKWEWGTLHSGTFPEQPFGLIPIAPVKAIFNSDTHPIRGGNFSIYANGFSWGNPFKVWVVTNAQQIMNLADFDQSTMMLSTGQNGTLFNKHREDLLSLWLSGEQIPFSYSDEAVQEQAEYTLVLTPAE